MNASIAALAYLAAGVLFILSLRGLSSPVTSRRGNTLGMVGMALAVGVTLLTLGTSGALDPLTLVLIAGGVVVGGGAGAVIANRVPMTAMPQLVAAFHSLVGLAACLVAVGAVYAPDAFGIVHRLEHILAESFELGVKFLDGLPHLPENLLGIFGYLTNCHYGSAGEHYRGMTPCRAPRRKPRWAKKPFSSRARHSQQTLRRSFIGERKVL